MSPCRRGSGAKSLICLQEHGLVGPDPVEVFPLGVKYPVGQHSLVDRSETLYLGSSRSHSFDALTRFSFTSAALTAFVQSICGPCDHWVSIFPTFDHGVPCRFNTLSSVALQSPWVLEIVWVDPCRAHWTFLGLISFAPLEARGCWYGPFLGSCRILYPCCWSPGLLFYTPVCAPKRGIGGSGPSARHNAAHSTVSVLGVFPTPRSLGFSPTDPFFGASGFRWGQRDVSVALGHPPPHSSDLSAHLLRVLLLLGSGIVPLARSICFLFFLALLRLACARRRATGCLAVRCFWHATGGVNVEACVPLGAVACSSLCQAGPRRPVAKPTPHPGRRVQRLSPRGFGLLPWLFSGLLSFLGPHSLPVCCPTVLPVACWVLLPDTAHAMARAEGPEDVVAGPPVPLPTVSSLSQSAGITQVTLPWSDPEHAIRASAHVSVRELPWMAADADAADGQWLGCYVYTPHYTTVALAVDMPRSADLQVALDSLLSFAPGAPEKLFDGIVPIRPQQFSGYLQVIRYPTILHKVHDGYAAVICNLTHVGGGYFATVLPRSLSHEDLAAYLLPLTSVSDEPLRFFIGCRSKVWPLEANVLLRDGDAITGTFDPSLCPFPHRSEDLENRANWGTLRHFFSPETRDCTCVMHREKRYCVGPHHHRGQSLNDYIVSFLQLDVRRAASCVFSLHDLDVQGDRCRDIVAVADVAPPTGGFHEPERVDFFVLCDVRPFGLKPRFLYTHVPRLHLPSLVADLGIALPRGYVVGVLGARVHGDMVRFNGNCTLLLYAKSEEDSSSSVPSPAIEPDAERPGVRAQNPEGELDFDTTLPEGHSWNVGGPTVWNASAEDSHSVWDDRFGLFSRPEPPAANPWPSPGADAYVLSGRQPQPSLDSRHAEATPGDSSALTRVAGPAMPPDSPHVPAPMPAGFTPESSQGFEIVALVYTPDVSPEMVATSLELPCGVDQAVAAVAGSRVRGASCGFSCLTPVTPQPCLEFMVLLASPRWLVARPMVLFDCLRLNKTLFAKVLFPYATRESLLLAAGLRHDAQEEVFVHGLLRPLQPGQRIQLLTGMVVSLAPPGCGAPATSDLATRLLSREGWDSDAYLPGPAYAPGMHYWVMTEGQPLLFTVGDRRRAYAREDLAHQLGARESALYVRATQPAIVDAFFNGYLATGVWVATESISRIPCPPARVPENKLVLVLDCRPLLLGIRWLLLSDPIVPVHDVTAPFEEYCPEEHVVTVTGAEAIEWGDESVFQFSCGQVIVLSFDEDISSSEHNLDPPPTGPSAPPDGHEPRPPDQRGEGHVPNSGAPSEDTRGRSRSPRPTGMPPQSGTGGSDAVEVPAADSGNGFQDRWRMTCVQDVVADDEAPLTPVSLDLITGPTLASWLCWFTKSVFTDQLLARHLSRQLFELLSAPRPTPAPPVQEEPGGELPQDEEEWALREISFALLAPEFTDEVVPMQVLLPQSVADVLELLDTSRGRVGFELFPRLCTVHPQPVSHAAVVLMMPDWLSDRVVVCLDMSQCDGGVFAAVTPQWTDRFALLNKAGLSVVSDILVFPPGHEQPVEPGDAVWACDGDCFRFAYPGDPLPVRPSLSELLSLSLRELGAPLAPRAPGDRYCLAGAGFYCDFELSPERSFLYRADIASRMRVAADRAIISPARPRIEDAAVYGRVCRTVIAVGSRDMCTSARDGHVGLLDCRPILEGWRRLFAPEGWLDLESLRAQLSHGAPPGHAICLSDCPDHWTWLWLEPGQTIRASYRPNFSEAGSSMLNRPPSLFSSTRTAHEDTEGMDSGFRAPNRASSSVADSSRRAVFRTRAFNACASMWITGFSHHACRPGALWLTSVALLALAGQLVAYGLAVCFASCSLSRSLLALLGFLFIEHFSVIGAGAVQLRDEAVYARGVYEPVVFSSSFDGDSSGDRRLLPSSCRALTSGATTSNCFSTFTDVGQALPVDLPVCDVEDPPMSFDSNVIQSLMYGNVSGSWKVRSKGDVLRLGRRSDSILANDSADYRVLKELGRLCVTCSGIFLLFFLATIVFQQGFPNGGLQGSWCLLFVCARRTGAVPTFLYSVCASAALFLLAEAVQIGTVPPGHQAFTGAGLEEVSAAAAGAAIGIGRRCLYETSGHGYVPTPCRSRRSSDLTGEIAQFDLVAPYRSTLLETAAWAPCCTAFWEASTLVEALYEHFADLSVSAMPHASAERISLSLDSLVPSGPPDACLPCIDSQSRAPVFDLSGRQCLLPCSNNDLDALLSPHPFSHLMGPPGDVPKGYRFDRWVDEGFVGRSPGPNEIMVLTSDGSYCDRSGKAGWAVCLSLVSALTLELPGTFIGCFYGSLDPLGPILARQGQSTTFDAYLAEICGLMWAAVAALQLPFSGQVHFRADNTSALQGVAGRANLREHPLCSVARNLFAAVQCLTHRPVCFQHVHGHAGDYANELADGLASLGAAGRCSTFPFDCDFDFWLGGSGRTSEWLPQLCLSRSRPNEVPRLQHNLLSWPQEAPVRTLSEEAVMQPFLRAMPPIPQTDTSKTEQVEFLLATYNVLSLLGDVSSQVSAGLHGAIGRPSLLASTLRERGVHLAGLQECRTPRGTLTCGSFRRFSSGCDEASCFGVELWVDTQGPFRHDTVVVLHNDPTSLIASLTFRDVQLRVLVGHAPHRAHTEQVRAAWWSRISSLCRAFSNGIPWIVLVDGNCRVGSEVCNAIGPHQSDPEDLSGAAFRGLLSELDAWLPATFADCMQGDGCTLCLHRNKEMVRSDYVGVPLAWRSGQAVASVDPGITTGHACIDHYAACLRLTLRFAGQQRLPRSLRIDAAAISHPENAGVVQRILCSAPRPSWQVDASEHAAVVVDHLYRGLAQHFPASGRRLRGSHFSERTSELHRSVATLRHSVRTRKIALRATRLRCAFLAWRQPRCTFLQLYQGRWLWELRHRLALSCLLLHRVGGALRSQCRADRAAYFSAVAEEIANSRPGELHQSVKKVMRPKRFRKDSADPLPILHHSDGTLCRTADDAQRAWRDHFSALEDGLPVSTAQLVSSCRKRQDAFEGDDSVEVLHVPPLRTLENSFRATSARKACGPDLLPPALCHHFSTELSLLFWPLMLKTVLQATEAAGLKGGLLHHIPKPNSALQGRCEGHRGILVQSCISKAIHRSMRDLAMDQWLPHALPFQIGGRRGCSAHFGHYCSRAFLDVMRTESRPAGVLFVDLAAAYYRVVRETVLGNRLGDRSVEDIAASLHLSPDDLQLLHEHIRDHPVLREQDSAPLFTEVARELHSHTWFVLAHDRQLVQTHRGTRPGGALADIIFNLLFSRVLRRRSQAAGAIQAPKVAWDGERAPFPTSSGKKPVSFVEVQDVVFADDLASFVSTDRADQLRPALGNVAAATLNVLPEHGLSANIGPTKTAAIVALHGRGSRNARKELFHTMRGRLPVWPENSGMVRIDLVTSYKHLGSVLTHDGGLLTEIRHRLGVGRAAFKEGKQRIFSCLRIPLERRAILFRSHVLSAVLAGCGAWPSLSTTEWRAFAGGLLSLFRQLLHLHSEEWRVTENQIYARVGLPCPRSLLNSECLRFLILLTRSGPDVAWALLRSSPRFQRGLREASDWLLEAVRGTCELADLHTSWAIWENLIKRTPGRLKGLIKRAELWHCERRRIRASFETFVRGVWPPTHRPGSSGLETCEHACLKCRIAFRTRQAWGAHAHRAHSYHNPAHDLARGRRCQVCGLLLASSDKLRLHLKHSRLCLQAMERPSGLSLYAADESAAHAQAPALAGPGPLDSLSVRPEICKDLAEALAGLQVATDQQIYDEVVARIAPLPALRQTLIEWLDSGLPEETASACEDVLLILRAEHLCDRIAGKPEASGPEKEEYCPVIHPPRVCISPDPLPVCWSGALDLGWVRRWGLDSTPPVQLSVAELCLGNVPTASGFCVCFPLPCVEPQELLRIAACPIRVIRELRLWAHEVLQASELLIQRALQGTPVHLCFPVKAQVLEPLSSWIKELQGKGTSSDATHFCFTAEFIASS